MEILVDCSGFIPFSALVMNAFAVMEKTISISSDGIQAPGIDGLRCVRHDPLGLAGGQPSADGH